MVDYDPFSDEAMKDPFRLYKAVRDEDPVYFMEKYNGWALTRFEDVWATSMRHNDLTVTGGQTPGQVLLGEPVPHSFMTMDSPDHKKFRNIIASHYAKASAREHEPRIRELVRSILGPLLEQGELEVYADLANRVTTLNASYMAGLPAEDGEQVRRWIDGFMAREPGQVGTSQVNGEAAGALYTYLYEFVADMRRHPDTARGHVAEWLRFEFDGRSLTDEELTWNLYSIMVTGSETTPLAVAGTLVYLQQNPDQKKTVLSDPSLVQNAFNETLRFDQPTNMLGRVAVNDFELGGKTIKKGQGIMMIYASANRDEREFESAGTYDILREPKRTLTYGLGLHRCLGEHVANVMGSTILDELFSAIDDYELDMSACKRVYSEHLSGYAHVPIRF